VVHHPDNYKEYVRKMDPVKVGNPLFRKPRYGNHARAIGEDYNRTTLKHG